MSEKNRTEVIIAVTRKMSVVCDGYFSSLRVLGSRVDKNSRIRSKTFRCQAMPSTFNIKEGYSAHGLQHCNFIVSGFYKYSHEVIGNNGLYYLANWGDVGVTTDGVKLNVNESDGKPSYIPFGLPIPNNYVGMNVHAASSYEKDKCVLGSLGCIAILDYSEFNAYCCSIGLIKNDFVSLSVTDV